jgi:hypothetical protein
MLYRKIIAVAVTLALALGIVGTALADTSPNGHGQPGAPGTTCLSQNALITPGNASSASGSAFNPHGTAGANYAGNPGTASLAHANSPTAVSQYDIACFQVSQPHP